MTEENRQTALDIVGSKSSLKTIMELPDFKESVQAVAGKYMKADHVIKAALLAISRQPKLLQCTKTSFLQSAIKAAELGLDFAGQTGQGYLIPFGKECQFIPGYQGFIEIAYRSERVNYIDAQLVYEKDKVEYNLGSNPFIDHKPYLGEDRGKVIFGYAIVKLVGSDIPKIELMSYNDIMKIKARSKAKNDGPWVTDEPEMMRKTVLRRAFKYIPKTPEIQTAMEADNEQFDMNIEELKNGNSNLGANGLKSRLKKVESKEVEEEPKDEAMQKKAKEQIKKLKQSKTKPEPDADALGTPVFICTDPLKAPCALAADKRELRIDTDHLEVDSVESDKYICPECGCILTQIRVE